MSLRKVAIVTGANKGIGLAIVRNLVPKFDGDVYLTSRNEELGNSAKQELEQQGIVCKYHQLDINDRISILRLKDLMKNKYGGVDVLINNAGIAFKKAATDPFGTQARVTIDTNYYGTKEVCQLLFPILKLGARVVNLTSSSGFLKQIKSEELRTKFSKSGNGMTVEELDALMEDFVAHAEKGDHSEYGWPNNAYRVSKVGVSALSRIQQKQMDKDDIVINHVHPGYVDTDMTSHKGPLTPDQGAMSSVFAAMLPPNTNIKGSYIWEDCSLIDWVNGTLP